MRAYRCPSCGIRSDHLDYRESLCRLVSSRLVHTMRNKCVAALSLSRTYATIHLHCCSTGAQTQTHTNRTNRKRSRICGTVPEKQVIFRVHCVLASKRHSFRIASGGRLLGCRAALPVPGGHVKTSRNSYRYTIYVWYNGRNAHAYSCGADRLVVRIFPIHCVSSDPACTHPYLRIWNAVVLRAQHCLCHGEWFAHSLSRRMRNGQ